jgi:tetratricopeptide (TPR) repeat protein
VRAVLVGLLVACASAARAADDMDPARLYARGERAEALAALADRGENRLEWEIEAVGRTRDAALLRAALMLYTDRALLERAQAPGAETARGCKLTEDDLYLRRIVDRMIDRGALQGFLRRWYLAMALQSLGNLCLVKTDDWVDHGLERFREDPPLLVVRGVASEAAAQLRPNSARDPEEAARARAGVGGKLSRARDSYERALAVDAGLVEARLRLGRVLWAQGELDAARVQLEQVTATAPPPSVGYLAHLFLARVHDDAGRPADAEREYRAALALDPEGQAAAVGLAQLLAKSGPVPRALLEEALSYAPRPDPRDLFWAYPAERAGTGEDELSALRDEASP